jgi:hypothetical protein
MSRRVRNKDVASPEVIEEYLSTNLDAAVENFAHYRVLMNPRFTLKKKWFPRTLAQTLRTFYDDFKAGKRPVLLLQTPPQHGKSLAVIDFIGTRWHVDDPAGRLIERYGDRVTIARYPAIAEWTKNIATLAIRYFPS